MSKRPSWLTDVGHLIKSAQERNSAVFPSSSPILAVDLDQDREDTELDVQSMELSRLYSPVQHDGKEDFLLSQIESDE